MVGECYTTSGGCPLRLIWCVLVEIDVIEAEL